MFDLRNGRVFVLKTFISEEYFFWQFDCIRPSRNSRIYYDTDTTHINLFLIYAEIYKLSSGPSYIIIQLYCNNIDLQGIAVY